MSIALGSIDSSKDGSILKWIALAMEPLGNAIDVTNRFHNNSQGYHRLDRWLGSKMCSTVNQKHPIFGLQIKTYVTHCQNHEIMPSGRVIAVSCYDFGWTDNEGHSPG